MAAEGFNEKAVNSNWAVMLSITHCYKNNKSINQSLFQRSSLQTLHTYTTFPPLYILAFTAVMCHSMKCGSFTLWKNKCIGLV